VYYFSSCGSTPAAGCVNGNNSSAGTSPSQPRLDLSGMDVNSLPAGTQLRFARGGVWADVFFFLDNRNATPTQPLVFESYLPAGTSASAPRPELRSNSIAFYIGGTYQNLDMDGGYTIRGFKINGLGTADTGFAVGSTTRNVLIEDNEITGFGLGFNTQNNTPEGIQGLIVRGNNIHHNYRMGFLGDAYGLVIEDNLFESNNTVDIVGAALNHAIYVGGHGTNGIIRRNRFINNSVIGSNGACTGGNLTVHGQWDGLLIEDNLLQQQASEGSCYGISVTPGYNSAEFFRNLVVHRNTVINLGGCAICVGAAVNPLIERNLMVNRNDSWMSGVVLAANVGSPGSGGDDIDRGATVRNNIYCATYGPSSGQTNNIVLRSAGAEPLTAAVNNSEFFGANATTQNCTLPTP
jgi:hypothetical protein